MCIWGFCDTLMRNFLLGEEYQLVNGKKVTKDNFVTLLATKKKKQKRTDLRFAYRIFEKHLLLTGTERQNARKVAELLSRTVVKATSFVFPGNDLSLIHI